MPRNPWRNAYRRAYPTWLAMLLDPWFWTGIGVGLLFIWIIWKELL